MTTIKYIKDKQGQKSHAIVLVDLATHETVFNNFLEDIEDVNILEQGENEETLSIDECISLLVNEDDEKNKKLIVLLEELKYVQIIKANENEKEFSLAEVRKMLLAKGEVSDKDLAKVS